MAAAKASFGLTLPNRGVVTGATTVAEMLTLAEKADASGVWDSVWVGDSIFAKPRLDSLTLMAAIAARTRRVRIGPACMASTPLRDARLLAYQWCSLDHLSGGRTVFVACQGGPRQDGGRFYEEFANFGIEPRSRMKRMEETIEILRLVSSQENASYEGEYYRFRDLTVEPRPVQQPIDLGDGQSLRPPAAARRELTAARGATWRRLDDHREHGRELRPAPRLDPEVRS